MKTYTVHLSTGQNVTVKAGSHAMSNGNLYLYEESEPVMGDSGSPTNRLAKAFYSAGFLGFDCKEE